MCGENNYTNINIKTLNQMNKEHLVRLQQKVNQLMRTSSEESDQQANRKVKTIHKNKFKMQDVEPETVRKCMDLMKQNKELKVQLQKYRRANEELKKQVLKSKRQKREEVESKQAKIQEQLKNNKKNNEQIRRIAKLEAELEEAHKRAKVLQQIIGKQRKKNKNLCVFINKNIPLMQEHIDRLTNKVDAKLQSHFSRVYDY